MRKRIARLWEVLCGSKNAKSNSQNSCDRTENSGSSSWTTDECRLLLANGSEFKRWKAADRLGELKDRTSIDSLARALSDKCWSVRKHAGMALCALGDKRGNECLIAGLASPHAHIRRGALEALAVTGSIQDLTLVTNLLKDERLSVRKQAEESLHNRGDASLPALIDAARADDSTTRYLAIRLLGEISSSEAFETVLDALDDDDKDCQAAATAAIKSMGLPAARRLAQILLGEIEGPKEKALHILHNLKAKRQLCPGCGKRSCLAIDTERLFCPRCVRYFAAEMVTSSEAHEMERTEVLFSRFRYGATAQEAIDAAREIARHFSDCWGKKPSDRLGRLFLHRLCPQRPHRLPSGLEDLTRGRPDTPAWLAFLLVVDQKNPFYYEYFEALESFKDMGYDVEWIVGILQTLHVGSGSECKERALQCASYLTKGPRA